MKQNRSISMLSTSSGSAFDRQFLSFVILQQTRSVAEHQRIATRKTKAAQFAEDELPTIEKYLRGAEMLMRNLDWNND